MTRYNLWCVKEPNSWTMHEVWKNRTWHDESPSQWDHFWGHILVWWFSKTTKKVSNNRYWNLVLSNFFDLTTALLKTDFLWLTAWPNHLTTAEFPCYSNHSHWHVVALMSTKIWAKITPGKPDSIPCFLNDMLLISFHCTVWTHMMYLWNLFDFVECNGNNS